MVEMVVEQRARSGPVLETGEVMHVACSLSWLIRSPLRLMNVAVTLLVEDECWCQGFCGVRKASQVADHALALHLGEFLSCSLSWLCGFHLDSIDLLSVLLFRRFPVTYCNVG